MAQLGLEIKAIKANWQGESGESADAASLDFSTLASYFEEDTDAPAGSVTFNFNTQQILIGSSGADV